MDYDKLLLKILTNNKGICINKLDKLNSHINILNYLNNRYIDSFSILETLKRLKLNIETKPICARPECNNYVTFIGKKSKMFSKYCSNNCRALHISKNIWQQKQKEYNIEHYGVEHNFQRQDVIDKRKDTFINKYGTTNIYDIDSISTKVKESVYNKIDIIKQHHNESLVKHYGCGFSELLKLPEIQQKKNYTMKQNNTYGKSKHEDMCYALLVNKYPDTIRQYYNKEQYPFNCDFYIPSIDTYIEYNGSQYHYKRPYLGTEEDLNEVEILKEKAKNSKRHLEGKKSQYDVILYTWTDLDVRKRNIAKENNLNYFEFWNIKELENWLNGKDKDCTI